MILSFHFVNSKFLVEQFSDSDTANDAAICFLLEMGKEFLKFNRQIKEGNEDFERDIQEGIDKMQNIVNNAQFIFTEVGQQKFNKSFDVEHQDNEPFIDFIIAVENFFSCQSIIRATKIELKDILSGIETKDELKQYTGVKLYQESIKLKIEELEKIKSGELVCQEFPLNLKRNGTAVRKLEDLILYKLDLTKGNF